MKPYRNDVSFKSSILRTDVTAVKLFGNYILAGIGSWVHVYHKESGKFIHKLHVLNGQKIYGFQPSRNGCEILVFGGKQFTVLSTETGAVGDEEAFNLSIIFEVVVCDDWVHAGVWINEQEVALLTAHNVVQIWGTSNPTLLRSHTCKDNSILYSGLLVPLADDVLVFSGTVFSEVIIRCCRDERTLHNLIGHKGVIFSIACDLQKQVIVTTSDDRSIRIWGPCNMLSLPPNTKPYWDTISLECKHEMYGHTARVMRSRIICDLIISVGEDSAICFWDFKGNLLRKNISHQNGCIWAIDADRSDLVTGGGDNGVSLHPLSVALEYGVHEMLNIEVGNPKKIVYTARRNIVVLNEADELYYYDVDLKTVTNVYKLKHESTYKLLSVSSCKQLIAVSDMFGNLDIFTENCKGEPTIINIINTKLNFGKILSMQWVGNRHLVLCGDNGIVTVLASRENKTELVTHFILPQCKERWLTASAIDPTNRMFALGDRCGNIHIYEINQKNPVKTFSKVHGRYGPTSITFKTNYIVTTGRDGTIKHFDVNKAQVKLMNCTDINFEWVEKFLDRGENTICGFQERVFVVFDIKNSSKLLEVACGGGHRSWDAIRYIEKIHDKYETIISLMYLKNSTIHISTFHLCKIISKNIVGGSHTKEINCLKSFKFSHSQIFYISGGEDTTLRISLCTNSTTFLDKVIFKNLSSVRTLKTFALNENELILVSAGGRAQICIKVIEYKEHGDDIEIKSEALIDYLIKGTDKERKGTQNWRNCTVDFDPETRIMDVDIIRINKNEFIIPAGCSDACLRIFKFGYNPTEKSTIKQISKIKYHSTCILKTHCFQLKNQDVLVSCTTRGDVAFWNITEEYKKNPNDFSDIEPFFVTKTNKSGINSISVNIVSETELIFATGGDDNAVHLNYLKFSDLKTIEKCQNISIDRWHCSEITGLAFIDGNLLLSASIDQRVTLSRLSIDGDGLKCTFVSQSCSDVADIQGINVVDNNREIVSVCVFGKGLEVMQIRKPS